MSDPVLPEGCVVTVSGPYRDATPDDRWHAWITRVSAGCGGVLASAGGKTIAMAVEAAIAKLCMVSA